MFVSKYLIMIRTALTGSAESCQKYLDILKNLSGFVISGVYLNYINGYFDNSIPEFNSKSIKLEKLIENSDILIVTNKAGEHFEIISMFLKRSRHVLIFPDTTLSLLQVKKLNKIAEEAGVLLNLYYNTLSLSIKERIKEFITQPEYIYIKSKIKRADIKIHNIYEEFFRKIYLIFELNPVNMVKYHITNIPTGSDKPCIIDLIMQFENGTAAHLNISNCYNEESEKLEIFGQNIIIRLEPLKNEFSVYDTCTEKFLRHNLDAEKKAVRREEVLERFLYSIKNKNCTENQFENGIFSHQVAYTILKYIHPSTTEY